MTSSNSKSVLSQFFESLAKSKDSLLILDYDGTLAPFAYVPTEAFPYPGVCERIERIMQLQKTKVVILSGRDLEGLKQLLPLSPLPELWGSHGGERLLPNESVATAHVLSSSIKQILNQAKENALQIAPEFYCEMKPLSIALHWRGKASHDISTKGERVREKWEELIGDESLEIRPFDGGLELRPKGINKGQAVLTLLEELPKGTLTAYLGDDLTDEQAFKVLGNRALKILVRKEMRSTLADFWLIPPEELLLFLDSWINAQQEKTTWKK